MKRLLSAAAALLCAVGLVAPVRAQTGMTPVTASNLKMGGVAIPSGTATFTMISANGANNPVPFTDGSGSYNGPFGFQFAITNGALPTGATVPDSCLSTASTANTPVTYKVDVVNSVTKTGFTISPVTGVCGTTAFALDHYAPIQTAVVYPTGLLSGPTTPSKCYAPSIFENTTTYTLYISGASNSCVAVGNAAGSSITSVVTNGLPAGAAPTSSIANGVLTLGIPAGAQGTPGTNGINGTNGSNGQGFNYRGAWSSNTAYALYDVVTNAGSSYTPIAAFTSGSTFNAANWTVLSLAGTNGADALVGSYTFANFPTTLAVDKLIRQIDAVPGSACTIGGGTMSKVCRSLGPGAGFAVADSLEKSTAAAPVPNGTVGADANGDVPLARLPQPYKVYTGLVATMAVIPRESNTGSTWVMSRTAHIARTAIAANTMQMLYANWVNEETNLGSATLKVSVEYPAGTFTLCTIGGVSTGATAAGGTYWTTDPCGPAIPNGARFWLRTLSVRAGGIIYNGQPTTKDSGFQFGTGTPTDLTTSGTLTGGGGAAYYPAAIIGPTTRPTACLVGDSRLIGIADVLNNNTVDASGDTGEIARLIGPAYAYTKIALSGSRLISGYLSAHALRDQLYQYCTTIINEYGVNDLGSAVTAANVAAGRAQFAALPAVAGKPIYGTTLPPELTSTDSFATTANQTTSLDTSAFNTLVKAGIVGETGIIDVAGAADQAGIGKWPVSPNVFATTGTANFAVPADGTHETAAMNTIIARALAYVTALITR